MKMKSFCDKKAFETPKPPLDLPVLKAIPTNFVFSVQSAYVVSVLYYALIAVRLAN